MIRSRGIPADEAMWLPRHDRVKQILAISTDPFDEYGAEWGVDGLLKFVFPPTYRPRYYEVAVSFLHHLLESGELHSDQIGDWVAKNGISKATFYNKVLPRLKRIGMVAAERVAPRKGAGYVLRPSLTFHNYLFKMAKEWQRLVMTSRARTK